MQGDGHGGVVTSAAFLNQRFLLQNADIPYVSYLHWFGQVHNRIYSRYPVDNTQLLTCRVNISGNFNLCGHLQKNK